MKIIALTGSRSDYDLLHPILRAIEFHPDMDLVLVASCAHLSHASGDTISQIQGFLNVRQRPSLLDWNTPEARLKSMALELIALAQEIADETPDLLLVLGDREDALLGAMAAQYSWIPTAHIFGGDQGWSTVDDSVRHAVSKLAHLHFPVSEASRDNLLALGESPENIHVCGNPALDRIHGLRPWSNDRLAKRFGLEPDRPVILLTQHPLTPDPGRAAQELETILSACRSFDAQIVLNAPNSDPGSHGSKHLRESQTDLIHVCNVEQDAWVALLQRSDVMVGNSSSGLLESAFLRIPTVNVGDRQRGRENAGNVQFVDVDEDSIREAIGKALQNEEYRTWVRALDCPFGDGHSAEKILAVLERTDCRRLIPKHHHFSGRSS